jgi:hypothetical protein
MSNHSVSHTHHQRNYQAVKQAFNTLHPFSRPDSLTRRGEMLILRRGLTRRGRHGAIRSWEETLRDLIPNARIHKSTIDPKHQLRIWFEI